MKAPFSIILLLFLINCNGINSDQPKQIEEENNNYISITKQEIEAIDFIDYGLSNASKKATKNWASYNELEALLTSIKNADLSYFRGDEEVIKTFVSDLKTTIPERIDSDAVKSRLLALETKFFKLKSAANISNISKQELLGTLKEFFESCSNFNLQMNKKFEKESQDILKPS